MAFILRRPFAVTAALKQAAPRAANINVRYMHNGPSKGFSVTAKSSTPALSSSIFARSKQTFQNAFRRTYMQENVRAPAQGGDLGQKLLYGAAIVGGTILATNLIFNRETREDGGMPPFERQYLNETFMHTGLGIGIIAVGARALFTSGWSVRMMAMNPWAVVGLGLVGSIGTMYATMYTPPEK
jgi:hypothetical protein